MQEESKKSESNAGYAREDVRHMVDVQLMVAAILKTPTGHFTNGAYAWYTSGTLRIRSLIGKN